MFEDEHRTFAEKLGVDNFLRYVGETGHIIGRVGENYVGWCMGGFDKLERVAFDERQIVDGENRGHFADEIILRGGFFDGSHPRASARKKFESDGSRAREEVGRGRLFVKIHEVFEHVEDVFARKVGRRSRRYVGRHVETPASVFSSDYSHSGIITRSKGMESESVPARNIDDGNIIGMT